MNIINENVDGGKPFDWGRTSSDYARYRDIYPAKFYQKIMDRGLCAKGKKVLDIGTGTGVLPRNLYEQGAQWTGTDISEEQIEQARILSGDKKITYYALPTEELDFPDGTFDTITACQCFWYFDHENVMPKLNQILKDQGSILVLYMAWLPYEDAIAGASEELVLKYSPTWSGAGETVHPIQIPSCYDADFELIYHEEYKLNVPFTRESWNGRMKACRGVGASLSPEQVLEWEKEHKKMLLDNAPEQFDILHYAAIAELRKRG